MSQYYQQIDPSSIKISKDTFQLDEYSYRLSYIRTQTETITKQNIDETFRNRFYGFKSNIIGVKWQDYDSSTNEQDIVTIYYKNDRPSSETASFKSIFEIRCTNEQAQILVNVLTSKKSYDFSNLPESTDTDDDSS